MPVKQYRTNLFQKKIEPSSTSSYMMLFLLICCNISTQYIFITTRYTSHTPFTCIKQDRNHGWLHSLRQRAQSKTKNIISNTLVKVCKTTQQQRSKKQKWKSLGRNSKDKDISKSFQNKINIAKENLRSNTISIASKFEEMR